VAGAGGSYAAPIAGGAWVPASAVGGPPADLDELAAAAGVPARRNEVEAMPAQGLRDIATDPDTQLLVVADEGGGPVASKLAGSPARDVLRDSRCPVVLAPPIEIVLPETPVVGYGLDRDDEVAPTVAAFAGALAYELGADLRQVHVDGNVPDAVADSVRAIGASLVVVGRPAHGALASALLGSLVHSLLKRPVAPVVVVPDAEHAAGRA
jgi:nucleotide-binding universal stress UspA family protein